MNHNYGTCPVCKGSGRVPAGNSSLKTVVSGYDEVSDTFKCRNCGGQYMYGTPSGKVRLNKEGLPCVHFYVSSKVGNCLHQYVCQQCSDHFQIDSGD